MNNNQVQDMFSTPKHTCTKQGVAPDSSVLSLIDTVVAQQEQKHELGINVISADNHNVCIMDRNGFTLQVSTDPKGNLTTPKLTASSRDKNIMERFVHWVDQVDNLGVITSQGKFSAHIGNPMICSYERQTLQERTWKAAYSWATDIVQQLAYEQEKQVVEDKAKKSVEKLLRGFSQDQSNATSNDRKNDMVTHTGTYRGRKVEVRSSIYRSDDKHGIWVDYKMDNGYRVSTRIREGEVSGITRMFIPKDRFKALGVPKSAEWKVSYQHPDGSFSGRITLPCSYVDPAHQNGHQAARVAKEAEEIYEMIQWANNWVNLIVGDLNTP